MIEQPEPVGAVTETARPATSEPTGRTRRRVAIASFSGTLIEFYDFIIYGTAAALVFPHVFFPALGQAAGTVVSLATFGVAFVARPFGSILFGHFGDRLGRKRTLVVTLLAMGIATVLVGLIPPSEQIGVIAPICVVLLRIVQGLAAGGEWAGATLFAAEYAPAGSRGFWSMFPSQGANLAISFANGTFLLTSLAMTTETFLSWGWRVPFLASAVLIVIGLYVRLTIDESPVFTKEIAARGRSSLPFAEALRSQPREILLAGGVGLTTFSFFFVTSTYLASYATTTLQLSRTFVLTVIVVGGLLVTLSTMLSALLSDRLGRRRVIGWSHLVGMLWALAIFPLIEAAPAVGFAVVVWITMFLSGVNYGPMGAFLPELFRTRYRYTAAGISYNIGAVVSGAVAPLVATPIVATFGSFAFGVFLALLCLTGAICTFSLRETRNEDMS